MMLPARTRKLRRPLSLVILAALSTASIACGSDAAPEPPALPSDAPAAATPSDPAAPVTPAPGEMPPPAPSAASHACPAGTAMKVGNAYTKLDCLPQLDEIDYWNAAPSWAAFDAVPVTVAILDGAFVTTHADLGAAMAVSYDFAQPGCVPFSASNAACRVVTPTIGTTPPTGQQLGQAIHGTVIAGVIAGRGAPGSGVVGVNPSASLAAIVRDVANDNLAALRFAVEQHVDVISMSWPLGAPPGEKDVPQFEALLQQATAQGTVVVMAAGNTRTNVDTTAIYPTRYSAIPGVIAVGSVIAGQYAQEFSNYGPGYVDLGAPGLVASSGGDFQGGTYSVQKGTSFSGPMVAAAASRVVQYLKHRKVAFTAAQVESILVSGSKADPALTTYFKEGRVLDMTALYAWVSTHY